MKYCGYENLTLERVERLFNLMHSTFTKEELLSAKQEELNFWAQEVKEEWY